MAVKTLHANNPAEVASAQSLDVNLGQPNRHMLILTGLAQSKTVSNDTDNINRDQVIIKLGRNATQLPKDGEWSATVGITSIGNGDSDLILATDSVDL